MTRAEEYAAQVEAGRQLLPDFDSRQLARNTTPVFAVAALTGFWAQGLFSVLVAMVVVSFLLYRAIASARIEPS